VTRELERVRGIQTVEVDLETKLVIVRGDDLEDPPLLGAIDEAGYDARLTDG
jgi:copper chaperone CopZ